MQPICRTHPGDVTTMHRRRVCPADLCECRMLPVRDEDTVGIFWRERSAMHFRLPRIIINITSPSARRRLRRARDSGALRARLNSRKNTSLITVRKNKNKKSQKQEVPSYRFFDLKVYEILSKVPIWEYNF